VVFILGLLFVTELLFDIPQKSTGDLVLSLAFSLIFSAVVNPVAAIYTYKLYISLKATKLPDVSSVMFRKWLTAFVVIGMLVIATMLVFGGALIALITINPFPLPKDASFCTPDSTRERCINFKNEAFKSDYNFNSSQSENF
jgi:uncharacterized membrane protein YedE/YeeE